MWRAVVCKSLKLLNSEFGVLRLWKCRSGTFSLSLLFCLDIGADPVDNGGMFVREKVARGHRYFYLVESVREGGRVRQRTIRALGRKDVLHASGELDRLIASLARHSERAMVLSDMEVGRLACIRIGGPLLFGRLCVVKRVSSPPIGALTDCFSAIRGGQFSALNNK